MLHQLLHSFKLASGCDVISTIIKLPDFIMLYMVALCLIPVSDRQRVRS